MLDASGLTVRMLAERMVDRTQAFALRCDAWRFRAQRADYYAYLAHLLADVDGRKTLHDVFEDDVYRYGHATVRGRLAAYWLERYRQTGGDLQGTWEDTLPESEVALLRAAQHAGAGALPATLRDLARAAQLIEKTRAVLIGTTAAGVAACAVAIALLGAIPWLTVPKLQQVFQSVPFEYHGGLTRALWRTSALLKMLGLPLTLLATVGSVALGLSLSRAVGPWRVVFDRIGIGRLYRDVQCIRFLAMLAILLRQHVGADARLRDALLAYRYGARPWLAWHVDLMLARLDAGTSGVDVFDTGLIDRETWWYLSDLILARGFAMALSLARDRVESHVMRRVVTHAAVLRWTLLLGSLALILGVAFWHYAVIDELRRAMTQFHATT